jgi:hypothetical protein
MYSTKYIIAYSGRFDRSAKVATAKNYSNRSIAKSASTSEWTAALDEAISWLLDPTERWLVLAEQLGQKGATGDQIRQTEDRYVRSLISQTSRPLEVMANSSKVSDDVRAVLRSLISSAIWAAITGVPR